jgi:hypothetical protein
MRLKMPEARTIKVVVATSAMLSFISFWRAAGFLAMSGEESSRAGQSRTRIF